MKKLLGLLILLMPALLCFAGNAVTSSASASPGFVDWAILNWKEVVAVIIAFLEFLLRVLPTDRDWSLIHMLVRILNALIPNRAKKKSDGNYVFTVAKVPTRVKL